MLVTPLPGVNRDNLLVLLRTLRNEVDNTQGPFTGPAYGRLVRYLRWATGAARRLSGQIRAADVDRLVLTRRYDALLAGASGGMAGSHQEGMVNDLVSLELAEHVQAFDDVLGSLEQRIARWAVREWFVVADSSFYIQNADKLADVDLHKLLNLPPAEPIRLLFPITVVDELDGLKEAGKHQARWRATHTLGLLDGVLDGSTFGILRYSDTTGEPATWRGEVNLEIVLDQPGHVRLPIADDEIIDRAVAIQALAARDVRLLTCDTGQHTRGRAAGLTVTKVAAKDPGPEPDWSAQDKPGNGTRAQRRERRASVDRARADSD
jgi:hypothetical protein